MEENVAIWNRTKTGLQNVKMPVNVSSAIVDIRVPWYWHHCTATVLLFEREKTELLNKCNLYLIKLFDIHETPFTISLLLCLPVGSHAYCRWYEKTQPLQVKTPASLRSCDGEPSQKWPRAGSWCSSGHGPGKRLVCKVNNEIDTFHQIQDYTATAICALCFVHYDAIILVS